MLIASIFLKRYGMLSNLADEVISDSDIPLPGSKRPTTGTPMIFGRSWGISIKRTQSIR